MAPSPAGTPPAEERQSQQQWFPDHPGDAATERKPTGTTGKIVAGVCAGVVVGMTALAWPFISPALRKHCLPYVPATDRQVANVLSLCRKSGAGGPLVDLGSGDGRIVLAAAKQLQVPCVGYELNAWLVWYSRLRARMTGLHHLARFEVADLWKTDLSPYRTVVIFGVDGMMVDLERKFVSELSPGSRVLACRFPLPNLPITKEIDEGIDSVWQYDDTSASTLGAAETASVPGDIMNRRP